MSLNWNRKGLLLSGLEGLDTSCSDSKSGGPCLVSSIVFDMVRLVGLPGLDSIWIFRSGLLGLEAFFWPCSLDFKPLVSAKPGLPFLSNQADFGASVLPGCKVDMFCEVGCASFEDPKSLLNDTRMLAPELSFSFAFLSRRFLGPMTDIRSLVDSNACKFLLRSRMLGLSAGEIPRSLPPRKSWETSLQASKPLRYNKSSCCQLNQSWPTQQCGHGYNIQWHPCIEIFHISQRSASQLCNGHINIKSQSTDYSGVIIIDIIARVTRWMNLDSVQSSGCSSLLDPAYSVMDLHSAASFSFVALRSVCVDHLRILMVAPELIFCMVSKKSNATCCLMDYLFPVRAWRQAMASLRDDLRPASVHTLWVPVGSFKLYNNECNEF